MSFICTRIKNHSHIFVLTPALQVEFACPGAKGYNSNHTPRQKNTHRPTNPQPSYEPPSPPPPPPPPPPPTKRNATLLEQNATPTKLRVQRKHNIGTCHGLRKRRSDIPWDRNLPPRSRTMVNTTNADKVTR